MIWIDDQNVTVDNEQRPHLAVAASDLFETTKQTHEPITPAGVFSGGTGTDPMVLDGYGKVLKYTEAVNQTVGGVAANGTQLGYSTGVLSVRQRWQKLTGLVIAPPKTAELNIGKPYGRVGLNNRSQNLLLGVQAQEVPNLLPSFANIARSYTRPDGSLNA